MIENFVVSVANLLPFGYAFGASMDAAARHPWESIDNYLGNTAFIELHGGFAYIAVGER